MNLSELISQAIKKYGELNDMTCLSHHHVDLHHSLDYGWGMAKDGEVVLHLNVWDEGILTYVDVYGLGPGGGQGAFYATINIDEYEEA